MIKYFNSNELNKYDLNFSDIYSYKNNYKLNCFLNKKSIFIKTPRLQLQSSLQSGYIVIDLNNITKKNELFINFIKKIEVQSGDKIKLGLKKKFKLHTNFVGDLNNKKYIFKNSDKNMCIFDKNKKTINSTEVEIYSDIILLIKLQDIWINTEKKQYGLNWTIFQCRVFPQFNYNICMLIDSDNDEDPNEDLNEEIKTEIIVQKCVFCNSICSYKNSLENIIIGKGKGLMKGKGKGKGIGNTGNSGGRGEINIEKKIEKKEVKKENKPIFSVSVNELVNMKNKLRKMTKIIDSDSD